MATRLHPLVDSNPRRKSQLLDDLLKWSSWQSTLKSQITEVEELVDTHILDKEYLKRMEAVSKALDELIVLAASFDLRTCDDLVLVSRLLSDVVSRRWDDVLNDWKSWTPDRYNSIDQSVLNEFLGVLKKLIMKLRVFTALETPNESPLVNQRDSNMEKCLGVATERNRGFNSAYSVNAASLTVTTTCRYSRSTEKIGQQIADTIKLPESPKKPRIEERSMRSAGRGLNPHLPHLDRVHLVNKVEQLVVKYGIVMISAPPGSGKSSLLDLVAARFQGEYTCSHLMATSNIPGSRLFADGGFDLERSIAMDGALEKQMIFLDDAHRLYREEDFWVKLMRFAGRSRVKMLLASTYHFANIESPRELSSITRIERRDLLLTEDECVELLRLPRGLPKDLIEIAPELENLILEECKGHVGAIICCCNQFCNHFASWDRSPTRAEILDLFMSERMVYLMDRCFGTFSQRSVSEAGRNIVLGCLSSNSSQPSMSCLSDNDREVVHQMTKNGVLEYVAENKLAFTSRIASRYVYNILFPGRGGQEPITLPSLILSSLRSVSKTFLVDSVVPGSFPTEIVFQIALVNAFRLNTPFDWQVVPELSRIFPDLLKPTADRIRGRIDFFIHGPGVRWGVEVLVNGDGLGEHIARFENGGKYHTLNVDDYVILDFRKASLMGKARRHPKQMTIGVDSVQRRFSLIRGMTSKMKVMEFRS